MPKNIFIMKTIRCNLTTELNYNKTKGLTEDYAHYYGDIVFTNKTHLDIILSRLGNQMGLPKYFKGKINNVVLCKDKYTNTDEIHDLADLLYIKESDYEKGLTNGKEIIVTNNKWKKRTVFQSFIKGTYYKWETTNGFYMILSQNDVDKLNAKEKRYLRL